jgi:xylulokinase
MAAYILAHDLGTTGDKATLFGTEGKLLGSAFSPYPTLYPRTGWAEQEPEQYWRAFCRSTRELLEKSRIPAARIAAVSFSGQMMAALPVDREGRALRNSIIWADLRSTSQAEALGKRIDADRVYRICGHRLSPSYSAAKIMWIKENEPEVYKRAHKFLQAKDYLACRLAGARLTDYSDASGMNLLDITGLRWSAEILEAAGIDGAKLPEIVESTEVIGKISGEAAEASGLPSGTPVVIGGGDGACATCGAGVVGEEQAYIYLGTSTWMAITSSKPLLDPAKRTFTFCHFLRGLYFPTGTMQAGGGSYQWLRNTLGEAEVKAAGEAGGDAYELLNREAGEAPCGSAGLLFLPYLMGERSPLWDPQARACFIGLTMLHGKRHLIRAVLEGVAFNMRLIYEAFREQGVRFTKVRLIGGGARSRLWLSIFADVLEIPTARLNFIEEATSVGAAIAGGVGVGLFSSIREADRLVQETELAPCDPANFPVYRKNFAVFRACYERLRDLFPLLSYSSG